MSIVRSYGRISIAALWLLSALGCSSLSDTPRVDLTGEDKARYEADLKACQAQAAKAEDSTQTTVEGTATGGILGGAINVGMGAGGIGAAIGTGAISAGIISGSHSAERKKQRVRACLDAKGYNLID